MITIIVLNKLTTPDANKRELDYRRSIIQIQEKEIYPEFTRT